MSTPAEATQVDYFKLLVEDVAGILESTLFVVERQTKGLTHEDSLVQLPFRGNCLNWVLGHIVNARGRMAKLLDIAPPLSEDEGTRYDTGSDAITETEQALPFERLLELLRSSTQQIAEAVRTATPESMLEIVDDRGRTRLERLQGLTWHETYHSGQFEYLRQAAGKDDKIF